jgi:hypothetical protein
MSAAFEWGPWIAAREFDGRETADLNFIAEHCLCLAA